MRGIFYIVLIGLVLPVWGQNSLDNANDLIREGKPDQAITILNGLPEDNPRKQLLLGQAYLHLGRTDLAEENIQVALDKYRSQGDDEGIAESLSHLGLVFWAKGQNYQALQYQFNSLDIRQRTGDEGSMAASYNDIGLVYSVLDPELAKQYYEKAHEVYTKIYGEEDERTANSYINLALSARSTGDYQNAVLNLDKALAIRQTIYPEGHPTEGFVFGALGQVFSDMGIYEDAVENFTLAEEIYIQNYGNIHPELANLYNMIATMELSNGSYEESLIACQKAMKANTPGFTSDDFYVNPVDLDYYSSDIMLVSLLLKGQALENRHFQKTLLRKDLLSSMEAYDIADELIDKLRHVRNNQEDKIFLSNRAAELYEHAIAVSLGLAEISLFKKEYYEKAFYFSEKSKSVVLLDAINDANAKEYANIPSDLLETENELRAAITFINQQLALAPDEATQQSLRQVLLEVTNDYNAFIKGLESDYPQYYNLKYDASIPTLEELQSVIPDNQAIQTYFIGRNRQRLYVFRVTSNNLRVMDVSLSEDFDRNLVGFRNSIVYNLRDIYEEIGYDLYKQVVPKKLGSKIEDLVIIPSGALGLIPFEALVTSPIEEADYSQIDYLVNDLNISYQYSIALYYQNLKSGKSVGTSAALFAPVEFDYGNRRLATLPATEKEVTEIGEILANQQYDASTLLYDKASEQRMKSGDVKDFRFLHIASHGIVNEKHPALTCIYLQSSDDDTNDGFLYSGEIYNLQLNADLVTMSACQTGLGKVSRGEGIIGLSRALLFAGAKNLVVSLWKVQDQSTAALMTSFYRRSISEQKEFNLALTEAKRNMIKNPETSRPYHWASFILIGR